MASIPAHCIAAGAVAVGATVVATQLHTDDSVPSTCKVASMAGSTAVAAALIHHGSLSKTPSSICVLGGLGGVASIGYGLSAHAGPSKVPLSCKLYTLAGVALIMAGAAALAKAK